MDVQSPPAIGQPATLLIPGGEQCACEITAVTERGVSITITTAEHAPPLKSWAPVILQLTVSGSLIKVESLIESQQQHLLELVYKDSHSYGARELGKRYNQTIMTDSPAHSANINREVEELVLPYLGNLLENFLERTDLALLQLAEAAGNNQEQGLLFEVKRELRQYQQEINQLICNQVRSRLRNPSSPVSTSPDLSESQQHDTLELVNLNAFEDWLSLEVIVRRARDKYFLPIACLQRRFSALANSTLSEEQIPVGVQSICEALRSTLKNYAIQQEALPYIYRFFEETVIAQLGELYDALNARLKAAGILPNAESQVLRELGPQRPASPVNAPTPPGGPAATAEGAAALPASTSFAPSDTSTLFSTAMDLMGLANGSGQALAGEAIPRHQLAEQIQQFQCNSTEIARLAEGMPLLGWMQQQLNMPLSRELQEIIQLVDNVFQTAAAYPQLTATLSSVLHRLRLPIAKLAVLDNKFFTSAQHPGKQLLNRLIELCLNTDLPNRMVESKLDVLANDITQNFHQDIGIFRDALDELDAISKQQKKSSGRNEERIVQSYEGRQRVQQAQREVEKAIRRRVSPPEAPSIVLELLDNGWRELLKLTYIKMGSDSKDWHTHLNTLDELLVWIDEFTEHGENNAVPAIDVEADAFADMITRELDAIFPGDYHYHDTVEHIRDTLKGKLPVNMVPITDIGALQVKAPNELNNELKAANPDLSRWFKRAQGLRVGEEFGYLDDDSGQRNLKLAWVSENQQHFVFVNRRGQKVFDFDLVDVANELSKGLVPVNEQAEWPLVERSMYATVQQTYQQLAYRSSHDELTGLINRKECERLLSNVLNEAKNELKQHCLLYFDIDNFALTNNLLGHIGGDQILADLGKALNNFTPETATAGRIAGNEFIVVLRDSDEQSSLAVANQLIANLEQHEFRWQEHTVQISLSIGVIPINKFTSNVVDLFRNAVSACQAAKKSGGNRAQCYSQESDGSERREELLYWINNINQLLGGDRLTLRAQKIVALTDSSEEPDSHYEILLAIRGDDDQLESPVEFIEAAECYNRMQRVDRWVVENTLKWMRELADRGVPFPSVSINLSGNSLNDELFLEFILDQLARHKVPTSNICFEVTETATINNLAWAADFIAEIKRIGCRFSLDDFGSGNASYQYLKHLPVDYLKIDGLFVREIHQNKNDYALVKSINDIAHLMGKKTIAEYAETEEVIEALREIGVDYAQGWAISKPVPFDNLSI